MHEQDRKKRGPAPPGPPLQRCRPRSEICPAVSKIHSVDANRHNTRNSELHNGPIQAQAGRPIASHWSVRRRLPAGAGSRSARRLQRALARVPSVSSPKSCCSRAGGLKLQGSSVHAIPARQQCAGGGAGVCTVAGRQRRRIPAGRRERTAQHGAAAVCTASGQAPPVGTPHRMPVGGGPSLKECPRWPRQREQRICGASGGGWVGGEHAQLPPLPADPGAARPACTRSTPPATSSPARLGAA